MGDMADDMADMATMYDDVFLGGNDEPSDYHLAMLNKDVWVTADGRHIPIREMELDHLRNTIRYIERGGNAYGLADQYLKKLQKELDRRSIEPTPVPTRGNV